MSSLSDAIKQRIQNLGFADKDIARAFFDAPERTRNKADEVSFETVQQKLSKLLNAKQEGEAFFFKSEARTWALATALQWEISHLQSLRARRVLIVDPRLPKEARAFLNHQADLPGAMYTCVSVELDSDDPLTIRKTLRDVALKNPESFVVTDHDSDLEFYSGAPVTVTGLIQRPRGWSLDGAPELVPQPPPRSPRTEDTDGMPMANPPTFEGALRAEIEMHRRHDSHDCILRAHHVREAVEHEFIDAQKDEREAAFRIDHLFHWIRRDVLPPAKLRVVTLERRERYGSADDDLATAKDTYHALTGASGETLVWTHKGRAFAVGPDQPALSRAFNLPGDPVPVPASLARLKEYLAHGNPWHPERTIWKQLCSDISEECGLDLDAAHALWRDGNDSQVRVWTIRPRDDQRVKEARAQLRDLLKKDFALSAQKADLPFVLEAIADAPLLVLPPEAHDTTHVVANLGAGHVPRVRILRFDAEQAEPLRDVGPGLELDGGNIHVWIEDRRNDLLESELFSRILRRRKEDGSRDRWDDLDDDE